MRSWNDLIILVIYTNSKFFCPNLDFKSDLRINNLGYYNKVPLITGYLITSLTFLDLYVCYFVYEWYTNVPFLIRSRLLWFYEVTQNLCDDIKIKLPIHL